MRKLKKGRKARSAQGASEFGVVRRGETGVSLDFGPLASMVGHGRRRVEDLRVRMACVVGGMDPADMERGSAPREGSYRDPDVDDIIDGDGLNCAFSDPPVRHPISGVLFEGEPLCREDSLADDDGQEDDPPRDLLQILLVEPPIRKAKNRRVRGSSGRGPGNNVNPEVVAAADDILRQRRRDDKMIKALAREALGPDHRSHACPICLVGMDHADPRVGELLQRIEAGERLSRRQLAAILVA